MDVMASLQGLVGGVLIGLSAVWLMGALGRVAGISGIIGGLVLQRPKGDSAWRVAFLAGLVSGPLLVMALGGGLGNVAGSPGEVIGAPAGGISLMLLEGLLVGLGTGLGSGCTSGAGGVSKRGIVGGQATERFAGALIGL